jgi:3-hydroxyacyl-CoA dehydrogenase
VTDVWRYAVHGDIAVITLDNPPVNGLSHALRLGISQGLRRAQDAQEVIGIVLIGTKSGFSGGADIREFGTPLVLAEPTLRTLIGAVEASSKPVTAAIGAIAMGGGLELALGCHYRVATVSARVALPEVKLGLLPGAGGTQRLPRLVGLEQALDMIVTGDAASAAELADTHLFDRVIDAELLSGAVGFAREVALRRPLPRVRDRAVIHPDAQGFLAAARARIGAHQKNLPAPIACVDALTASLGPFDEGLVTERALFTRLLQGPESAALRHAFFAERAAAKVADLPRGTKPRAVRTAAVVGAGTMGGGIAMCFADAGIPVVVVEQDEAALARAIASIRGHYEVAVRKAKLTPAEVQQRLGLIRGTLDVRELAPADVIIEAVFEDLEVKRRLFAVLDVHAKPDAILASNTSTLNIDTLASFTRRPAQVLGLHFFSPASVMRLIEIVRGKETSHEVLAGGLQLAKSLGKVGVVARVGDGFIGNRMLRPYLRQAELLLLEGCLPQQLDAALERWGWAMGPCRMQDLAGNDIGAGIRRRHYAEEPGMGRSLIADRLVELGRLGQKVGCGYYRYEPNSRAAQPDPQVEELILTLARTAGIRRRTIADEEIVTRCVYALINEGARVLEEGIAARASDIDVVYLLGYGFPRVRGGPMFYAQSVGLPAIVRSVERLAQQTPIDPGFWTPAPLLTRLAEEGKSFDDC